MRKLLCVTLLAIMAIPTYSQSMKEKLVAKYGYASEYTSNGKKWYSIRKDDKYGVCDDNGNELLAPAFDNVYLDYKDKYIQAQKDKKTSIYSINGKLIVSTPYEDVRWWQIEDGYCAVKQGGLWGAMDKKGKLVVPCEFEDLSPHTLKEDGFCNVKKNKKEGIYDMKAKQLIISCEFDDISTYGIKEYGLCSVKKGKLVGGYDVKKKQLLVPCEFDDVSTFMLNEQDYCTVKKNGKEGIYDIESQQLIIPCDYDDISTYQLKERGWTEVKKGQKKDAKIGIYDIRKKQEIVPCLYDWISTYNDTMNKHGLYFVIRDGYYGISNDQAKEVVPCRYDFIRTTPYGDCKYFVAARGGKRPADEAPARLHSLSRPIGSLCGVLDVTGREVVPFEYDQIYDIKDDVAECHKGTVLILKEEQTIRDYFDNNKPYKAYNNDYNYDNRLEGFYNLKTGKSTPCQYKGCIFSEGYIACSNSSEKWGYLDAETMQLAIPFEYESAQAFKDGVAQVKKDGKATFVTDPKKGTTLKMANGGASIKVDTNIPSTTSKQEESFAFIIANENYAHLKGADYAINDGKVFKEYCLKTFGMPESNVRYFEDATYGNMANAVKKIKDIADVYEGDANIIVYFSGLGATDVHKERYLLPTDATLATLNVTGYSLQKLMDELNALKTKQTIVILDAPFSGLDKEGKMLGDSRGVAIAPKPAAPHGNTVLITGCGSSETAYSLKDYGHSLFTYGLLDKIQDSKGKCSLKEAVDYATSWVKKESLKRFNKTQSPSMKPSEAMTGKIQNIKF